MYLSSRMGCTRHLHARMRASFISRRHVISVLSAFLCQAVAFFCSLSAAAQYDCTQLRRADASTGSGREAPARDYIFLNYNARTHQTSWYDEGNNAGATIPRNGSFFPVVYSREKLAVHVCDLHFGDVLTVTLSSQGLAENGADIRGASATTTAPSAANALDVLQGSEASGSGLQLGGNGFAAASPLSNLKVSDVTRGTISDSNGLNYQYASVDISPRQLAEIMLGTVEAVQRLNDSMTELWRGGNGFREGVPGSISDLHDQAEKLKRQVEADSTNESERNNAAVFDQDDAATGTLVSEMTNLSGMLNSQAFGARAAALQNNFIVIDAILDLARTGVQSGLSFPNCYVGPVPPDAETSVKVDPTVNSKTGKTTTVTTFTATAKTQTGDTDVPKQCPDPPSQARSLYEKQMFQDFLRQYNAALGVMCNERKDAEDRYKVHRVVECSERAKPKLDETFAALAELHQDLEDLDSVVAGVFRTMNEWNDHSRVEQTDLLPPLNGNGFERVSIVVQHNYVPFTFSGPPSATTATQPTAPPAPASALTATTGTPAHAVTTVLVEVHRLANFNLAGGVAVIHVPTATYSGFLSANAPTFISNPMPPSGSPQQQGVCGSSTFPIPGSTASQPTVTYSNYYCISPTQQARWQVAGFAGIAWYFAGGHDYFPYKRGIWPHGRNWWPSLLVGTAITQLGSGLGAINWEPMSGIDLFGGIASAHSSRSLNPPIVGISGSSPAATYSPPNNTQLHVGLTLGIGFDLQVFTTLFKNGASAPTLP